MKALPFTIPRIENQSFLVQEDKLEGFYPHLHRHVEVQICWIKKGQGKLLVQGDVYLFSPGDIFIIGSNKAHLFKSEMGCSGIESISLFFEVNPTKSKLMALPEMKVISRYFENLSACNQIENYNLKVVQNYLIKIQKSSKDKKLSFFIRLLSFLQNILKVEQFPLSVYSDKDGDSMKYIMWYTLEKFNTDISLQEIAGKIGYTPEAFCRFFKKRTGKTYVEYLNGIRISEACNKLVNQDTLLINQIAFECGFNNVSHFNRVFKKFKSCSPRIFRENYEKEIYSN